MRRRRPLRIPVFVLRMPRSGSTLVEQILASHSQVFAAGERHDFNNAVEVIARANNWSYPEMVANMSAEQLRQLGTSYVDSIRACAPTAARIIDKLPGNFGSVGLILALPNARIFIRPVVRSTPVFPVFACYLQQGTRTATISPSWDVTSAVTRH
jgi:hypothetical protein